MNLAHAALLSTLKTSLHVKDLKGDQFLHMCKAEEDGLLTISIGIDLDKSAGYNNNNNNNIDGDDDDDDDDLEVGHPQSGSFST